MKRYVQLTVALFVIAAMVLSACATPTAPTAEAPTAAPSAPEEMEGVPQELIWTFPFSQRWDPATSSGFDFYAGNAFIFGTLTRFTAEGDIVPWLAESYGVSDDGLEYTFTLRKDLRFNTGNPVNAHDFKFSWERAVELGSLAPRFLANVEGLQAFQDGEAAEITGIVVEDDYTLVVRMALPFIPFLAYTTVGTLGPVEEAQVAVDTPEKRWMEDGGGGAGPYMIQSFDPEPRVMVAVPNPYYFGEKPNLDKITYFYVSDPQTMQLMYESGELDAIYATGLDINVLSDPSNPLSEELLRTPGGGIQFSPFRIDRPPFDDPKFREAFRYAFDYEGIINSLFPYLEPLDGIAPASNVWPGKTCGVSQDVERAQQAFADSSYGGDPSQVPTIIFGATPGSELVRYLQAVQEQVRDVLGVTIDLLIKDSFSEEETAALSIRNWPAGIISGYPGYYIDLIWWSGNMSYHTGWTSFQSDEVDALIEQAHSTPSLDENLAAYEQVIDIVCGEYLFVPGWKSGFDLLVKPYVKGLYTTSFNSMPVDLEEVEILPH